MKKMPLKSAKDVLEKYKLDQVILVGYEKLANMIHTVTYGKTKEDCKQAAIGGEIFRNVFDIGESKSIRTLSEILEDILSGKKPTYDELLYSVLVYRFLLHSDRMAFKSLSEAKRKKLTSVFSHDPEYQEKEFHQRMKSAMASSPREFVGWEHDPRNPDYQKEVELPPVS